MTLPASEARYLGTSDVHLQRHPDGTYTVHGHVTDGVGWSDISEHLAPEAAAAAALAFLGYDRETDPDYERRIERLIERAKPISNAEAFWGSSDEPSGHAAGPSVTAQNQPAA